MDIGIGLPAAVPGVDRDALLEWARRAEARGFSSLGVIDRLVYLNYEPLTALTAAAAVTERIGLFTDVLLVPWRNNPALLAKQVATLDSISGGRVTLGVGIGAREDDYEASEVPMSGRGKRMDAALERMKEIWAGDEIGPAPVQPGGPRLLFGGGADATYRRAAQFGDGWTLGGGAPEFLGEGVEKMRAAWSEAGRDGEPRIAALCYFALGENAREDADASLTRYYGWFGEDAAKMFAANAVIDEDAIRAHRDGYATAGADEVIYFPTSTDPAQVDLLAEAVL